MGINPKNRRKRVYYRNGVAALEEVYQAGILHGHRTTWHRNGRIASKETYRQGVLHGVCRQWNEQGKLLGSYRMINGTGIQHLWYEDGHIQNEFSTVNGTWTGRRRFWLRDGTLASEAWLIENREVSRAAYLKAAADHADWPRYAEKRIRPRTLSRKRFESLVLRQHCEWLLSKLNQQEAAVWLARGNAATRSMGRLGFQITRSLIAEAARLGALKVIAADIYHSKQGKEFCDNLLIELPKSKPRRSAVRQLFLNLPLRAHCVVQPDKDRGEKWSLIHFG
jgi:hypothetical protein